MLAFETKGDGHPDSKFANELDALHKYKISYLKKNTLKNIKG